MIYLIFLLFLLFFRKYNFVPEKEIEYLINIIKKIAIDIYLLYINRFIF